MTSISYHPLPYYNLFAFDHSSSRWKDVAASKRKEVLEENMGDDGEFWMSFDDMKRNFTDFEICNVTIDQLYEDEKCKFCW